MKIPLPLKALPVSLNSKTEFPQMLLIIKMENGIMENISLTNSIILDGIRIMPQTGITMKKENI